MQTLTINVDESYLEQVLTFLQQIPKNKREIFQHTKLNISSENGEDDVFLTILANGPTISEEEVKTWEKGIKKGYKFWTIEEFYTNPKSNYQVSEYQEFGNFLSTTNVIHLHGDLHSQRNLHKPI